LGSQQIIIVMTNTKSNLSRAAIIGLALALPESLLVFFADPEASSWIIVQGALFWFTTGVVIGLVQLPFSPLLSAVLVSVFLNLPWYINLVIIPKDYGHLLPLIIASMLFGLIGACLKLRLIK